MHRLGPLFLLFVPLSLAAQLSSANDPSAVSLAQKAIAALTGGATITDVTLNASVAYVLGADNQSGSGTFMAKGTSESRFDLTLNNGETRSDVRNVANGQAAGGWMKNGSTPVVYAAHNCWTDAAWFYPALSSLTQTGNKNFVFKYLGQITHAGVNTQHIQVFQFSTVSLFQHISTIDFYLDPSSHLPLALTFQMHPDTDASKDVPAEVRFAGYQPVNGFLVPFSVLKMLNGTAILNITVTSAGFNTGLPDSTFSLQ